MAKAGAEINPEDFYPEVKKHRGKSRYLPLSDPVLRKALEAYLRLRLAKYPTLKKTSPLFLTQKGVPLISEHFTRAPGINAEAVGGDRAREFPQWASDLNDQYHP